MITREFSEKTNRWLGWLLAAVTFACLCLTWSEFSAELEFFKTARRTTAEVTGLSKNWTWSSVRYTDSKGGSVTIRTTTHSSWDTFIVGEQVEILCNEQEPPQVKLNRWSHLWGESLHTAFASLLLGAMAALTLTGKVRWGPLKQTRVFGEHG